MAATETQIPTMVLGVTAIGLGFRVPLIAISPWSRGGWVSSEVSDHTSVLRFLERWTAVADPDDVAIGLPPRSSTAVAHTGSRPRGVARDHLGHRPRDRRAAPV